jgi:hypothetical protein
MPTPIFLHGKNTRVLLSGAPNPYAYNVNNTITVAPPVDQSNQLQVLSADCPIFPGMVIGPDWNTSDTLPTSSHFTLDAYGNPPAYQNYVLAVSGSTITMSCYVDATTAASNNVSLTDPMTLHVGISADTGYATDNASFDVSQFFNDVSVSTTVESTETTTFQTDGSKSYIAGLKDGQMTLSGFYDGTLGGIDAILSNVMNAQSSRLYGVNNYSVPQGIVVFPDGNANNCFMAQGFETKYDLKSSVSGVVTVDADVQVTGGVRRGWGTYTTFGTLDGSSTSATVALPAYPTQTENGGLLIGGVTGIVGAENFQPDNLQITWTLQHSQDGLTWVDDLVFYGGGDTLTTNMGLVSVIADSKSTQEWQISNTVYPYVQLLFTISNSDGTNTDPVSVNFYFGFARY